MQKGPCDPPGSECWGAQQVCFFSRPTQYSREGGGRRRLELRKQAPGRGGSGCKNHQLQGKRTGPLARATPAPSQASGPADLLQNCNPARVGRGEAKGQERSAPRTRARGVPRSAAPRGPPRRMGAAPA